MDDPSVRYGEYRAVGFVLPWNEIIPLLESEGPQLGALSTLWIQRVLTLEAGASSQAT